MEKKGLDPQEQGCAQRAGTQVSLTEGKGDNLRMEGTNPAVVGSSWGPQHWEAGRGKGRRGGHVCRTAGRGQVKQMLSHDKGDSSS